jgi:predicted enzyme related to lactoylglutathione lyase
MTVRTLFPILITDDLPALQAFYESALGGVVDYRFGEPGHEDYVSLRFGDGVSLGIGRSEQTDPTPTHDRVALWFSVDDVDDAWECVLAAGGVAVQPPSDMPWGERVAQVRDAAGTLVNLASEGAESS